jgi:hypothetical protein
MERSRSPALILIQHQQGPWEGRFSAGAATTVRTVQLELKSNALRDADRRTRHRGTQAAVRAELLVASYCSIND